MIETGKSVYIHRTLALPLIYAIIKSANHITAGQELQFSVGGMEPKTSSVHQ